MAIIRENPYGNARFIVELGGTEVKGVIEVTLPEMSIDTNEFRAGGSGFASATKLPGQPHVGKLIVTRGYDGSLELTNWMKNIANGEHSDKRLAVVQLLSEDRTATVTAWRLGGVFPVKITFSQFVANGCEIVTETVEFSCDTVALE